MSHKFKVDHQYLNSNLKSVTVSVTLSVTPLQIKIQNPAMVYRKRTPKRTLPLHQELAWIVNEARGTKPLTKLAKAVLKEAVRSRLAGVLSDARDCCKLKSESQQISRRHVLLALRLRSWTQPGLTLTPTEELSAQRSEPLSDSSDYSDASDHGTPRVT